MLTVAIVLHLIADWVFQDHWMAINKSKLTHPAAWVHGGIHCFAMFFVFPPLIALAIALIHVLIDTRRPVQWWQKFYGQTTDGEYAIHVAIWLDQVFHISVLAFFVLIVG